MILETKDDAYSTFNGGERILNPSAYFILKCKNKEYNMNNYVNGLDDTYKEAWLQWRLLFLSGAGDWNIHYYMPENDLNKALMFEKNKITSSEYIVSMIILNRSDFLNTYNTPENVKRILDSLNGKEFVGIQLMK